jgi:uncharacterized membrane protein
MHARTAAIALSLLAWSALAGCRLPSRPPPEEALRNADLAAWSDGEEKPPDAWMFGGAGTGTIRRSADGGQRVARIAVDAGAVALYQDLRDPMKFRGREYRFTCSARAEMPEAVELAVQQGGEWALSQPHLGDGKWEELTIVGTVPDDAAAVRLHLTTKAGAIAQVAGCSLRFEPAVQFDLALVLGSLALLVLGALGFPQVRRTLLGWMPQALVTVWSPERWEPLRTWLRPERFLVLAGGLAGLAFLVLTPPFQVADEPAHFFRAFALAELRILPQIRAIDGRQVTGAELPRSFFLTLQEIGYYQVSFRNHRKVDPQRLVPALRRGLETSDRVFFDFGAPVMYAPVPYLPQALAISVGRAAGASPVVLLYLARLANLLAWLAGMFFAIRLAPFFKWGLVLLALTPMAISLAASASPDAATAWLSFVVIASFLAAAFRDPRPIGGREIARLLALALVLSLCKQLYFVLSALFLLVPARKLGGPRRRAAAFALMILLQLGMNALWWYLAMRGHPYSHEGTDPGAQLSLVLAHPLKVVWIFFHTLRVYAGFYLSSFVGNLGWLDTPPPNWLVVAYLSVAVMTAVFFGVPRGVLRWRHRLLLFLPAALIWAMILGYHYLIWTKVGADLMEGPQGRYLIPLAPIVLLAFADGRTASDAECIKLRLAGFCALVLATGLTYSFARYYLP